MILSSYIKPYLLDLAFRGIAWSSRPGTGYWAAFTVAPTAAGGGTEVTGGNYARVSFTFNGSNFTAAASAGDTVPNAAAILFNTATATWGDIVAIACFDASSGGNMLFFKEINPITIAARQRLAFEAGDLVFSLAAPCGNYLSKSLLNHLLTSASFPSIATHYLSLGTGGTAAGVSGEPTIGTNNYARKGMSNNATTWAAAAGNLKKNGALIQFNDATGAGTWGSGALTYFAIYDASSAGNCLWCDVTGSAFTITLGDQPEWAVNDLTLTLD